MYKDWTGIKMFNFVIVAVTDPMFLCNKKTGHYINRTAENLNVKAKWAHKGL